jgi:hypothetical protein
VPNFGWAITQPSEPLLAFKIFGNAGALPSRKIIRHFPLAVAPDLPIFPFHDLPISFGSAGASPSRLLA